MRTKTLSSLEEKQNLPLSAVFVDVENMAVNGVNGLAAFEIGRVMTQIETTSRPILRRAYADWAKLRTFRSSLLRFGFDQVQATYMNQSKNGLDIQMALDALETCLVDTRINLFYLVTADSDFGPLARALRRHGRFVVGVGWREKTNDIFRQHCDLFVDYDDLPGEPVPQTVGPAPRPAGPPDRRLRPARPDRPERPRMAPSAEAASDFLMHDPRYDAESSGEPEPSAVPFISEPRPVQRGPRPARRPPPQTRDVHELNAGIAALVDEHGPGARLNPSQFQRAIRRIDPGFTPMAFGYGSLPEFVEAHPLLSRAEVDGGPNIVVLPDAEALEAARQAPEPAAAADLAADRAWADEEERGGAVDLDDDDPDADADDGRSEDEDPDSDDSLFDDDDEEEDGDDEGGDEEGEDEEGEDEPEEASASDPRGAPRAGSEEGWWRRS